MGPQPVGISLVEKPHAFLTLDALRGVAAIAVMAFHYRGGLGRNPFPEGYLAVDFFFMLSGFVLTYAYQLKLDAGWSTVSFLKVRVARLYPLYLLGLLLGLAYRIIFVHADFSRRETALSLLLGLLVLPGIHLADGMFPLNSPAWSLFFEYVVNALHALFMRRRSLLFLGLVVLVSAAVLITLTVHTGSLDTGAKRREFFSLPRIIFPYALGMLLFRVWKSGRLRIPNASLLACALLIAPMAVLVQPQHHAAFELGMIVILFPIILLLGAASPAPRQFSRTFQLLGEGSYAIYVLHVPIYQLYGALWERLHGRPLNYNAPWATLICVILTIAFALLADRLYDRKCRAVLRSWLMDRPKPTFGVTSQV